MGRDVSILAITKPLPNQRIELVLESLEQDGVRWSKVYDGSLFLSMDAQSLGLLESVPDPPANQPRFRLKRSGNVSVELLTRMRFVEAREPESQGK